MKERIQKVLARSGVASRRHVERMIAEGRVKVNRSVVQEMGMLIDPEKDEVRVDGHKIDLESNSTLHKEYFLFNKPRGVVTTTSDEKGRTTVMDLLKLPEGRFYPVGRLDYDSEGALLITNDGDMAHQLLAPGRKVEKVYQVKVKGVPANEELAKLRKGIYIDDGPTGPNSIQLLRKVQSNTWLEVKLTKGKNRQIRKMFWRIKRPVIKLVRTEFAGLSTKGLEPGAFRVLSNKEISKLESQCVRQKAN